VPKGRDGHLRTIHAPKDGDSTIVEQTRLARAQDAQVVVITADRALQSQVEYLGASTMSPTWLLSLLSA
ncbi:MAG TPA: hypothetical protein PKA04_07550, partial [Marmoricola sp.]|nr:hypothetical protein [Marmoricola sp.]